MNQSLGGFSELCTSPTNLTQETCSRKHGQLLSWRLRPNNCVHWLRHRLTPCCLPTSTHLTWPGPPAPANHKRRHNNQCDVVWYTIYKVIWIQFLDIHVCAQDGKVPMLFCGMCFKSSIIVWHVQDVSNKLCHLEPSHYLNQSLTGSLAIEDKKFDNKKINNIHLILLGYFSGLTQCVKKLWCPYNCWTVEQTVWLPVMLRNSWDILPSPGISVSPS